MTIYFAGTNVVDFTPLRGKATDTTQLDDNVRQGVAITGNDYCDTSDFGPTKELWFTSTHYIPGTTGSAVQLISLIDAGDQVLFDIYCTESANPYSIALRAWNGSSYTVLDTGLETVTVGKHRFDYHVKIDSSVGEIELYIDGAFYASFSGNTNVANDRQISAVRFYAGWRFSSPTGIHSAVIVADEDTRNMVFIEHAPSGAGDKSGWDGAYTDVDDIAFDDGDIIKVAADNKVSLFSLNSLDDYATGYDVAGLVLSTRGIIPGSDEYIAPVFRLNDVTYAKDRLDYGYRYTNKQVPVPLNPATGEAWTVAEVAAMQVGFRSEGSTVPPTTDVYWDNVVLLLQFDGPDESTFFADKSSRHYVIGATGNAQLDRSVKAFGVSSLLLDGNSDYLTNDDTGSDLELTDEDWTFEFRIRPHAIASSGTLSGVFVSRTSDLTHSNYALYFTTSRKLDWYFWLGSAEKVHIAGTTVLDLDADFYHVAVTRKADTGLWTLFVNGVTDGTDTESAAPNPSGLKLRIGTDPLNVDARCFNGWIDSIRVTKGICRYDDDFLPLEGKFPIDINDQYYRYWRVRFTAVQGSNGVSLSHVMFFERGTMETVLGGSAIATSGTGDKDDMFDYSTHNWWASDVTPYPWIGYDFGEGNEKNIVGFGIMNDRSTVSYSPTAMELEYSDDGIKWNTLSQHTTNNWLRVDTYRFFLDPAYVYEGSPWGSHSYWRFLTISDPGSIRSAELEWYSEIEGENVAVDGTPSQSTTYSTNTADKAYDGDTGTYSETVSSSYLSDWVGYQFSSPVKIAKINYYPQASSRQANMCVVQFSDDGSNYHFSWGWEYTTFATGEFNPIIDSSVQADFINIQRLNSYVVMKKKVNEIQRLNAYVLFKETSA